MVDFLDRFRRKKPKEEQEPTQTTLAGQQLLQPTDPFAQSRVSTSTAPEAPIDPTRHFQPNPDGTVTVTQTGASGVPETFTLSAEEHRALDPFPSGIARPSPQTERLAELQGERFNEVLAENRRRLFEQQIAALQNLPGERIAPAFGLTEENIIGLGVDVAGRAAAGGAAGAAAGLAGGAAAPVTVPVAAVGGAVLGAGSAVVSTSNRIQANRDEAIQKGATVRQKEEEIMTDAVNFVNQGGSPIQATAEFTRGVENLQTQRAYLKQATTGSFGQELAKGQDELWEIERVLESDVPRLQSLLQDAILAPDATKVLVAPRIT